MLMFTFHIAFALGLMALTFGLFLKKSSCNNCCAKSCETTSAGAQNGCKSKCRCWAGLIIVILALLSLICTGHAGYQYWKAGAFKMPVAMEATSETINMKVQ
ncbi:MAG: hypothetical protein ACHQAX_06345 [Gammaproteobacteria bacterium]